MAILGLFMFSCDPDRPKLKVLKDTYHIVVEYHDEWIEGEKRPVGEEFLYMKILIENYGKTTAWDVTADVSFYNINELVVTKSDMQFRDLPPGAIDSIDFKTGLKDFEFTDSKISLDYKK